MKISVAIVLLALVAAEPISCQRLPRTRSRLSAAEAEAAASEKSETFKKLKSKTSTEAVTNTSTTTPSTEASPPSPSPSPSPPPPSSSSKSSATPSSNTTSNKTSPTSTTTPEPTSTSSAAPPVSSVQVRMAFAPAKKGPEERTPKSVPKEDDTKNKKSSDTQESPKESLKKSAPTSTSSPSSTSTAKPTPKSPSTKKPEQDEELRDALKRIHQEVLKQPRSQEAKNKSSNSTTTTKKPPKEEKGLETAESVYVRPPVLQQRVQETDAAPLDAQASIQSTKFVLRDQSLQVLPSFVRSKDRSRPTPPGPVRHILVQKQLPVAKPVLVALQRQRADPIDEEAIGSTTTTTAFPHIPIVHFDKEQSADGSYKTSYETANNIFAEETGFLRNPGVEDQEALVQQGSYSYTAPDGSLISVTYTADEQGFRATGTHLPTPPPISPEIQRSLDIIYAQIQRDEEEAEREAELERQGEASETHEESLSPPTTGSKRESRRYLPEPNRSPDDQY